MRRAITLATACLLQAGPASCLDRPRRTDAGSDALSAEGSVQLLGAPLVFAPTAEGFGVNAVVGRGSPAVLRASVRRVGAAAFGQDLAPSLLADDVAQWVFDGLAPDAVYQYRIVARDGPVAMPVYQGEVRTQPGPGAEFTFALLADTHIQPRAVAPLDVSAEDYAEAVLRDVALDVAALQPDFVVHLGDVIDFHLFGFNDPPPEGRYTKLAYLNYRRLLGDVLGNAPHFVVIGNWDGENGDYSDEEIGRSRTQRLLYVPGPKPDTYPQGGGAAEDYYAFTWGDALFVVLNVMTYTPTSHLLDYDPGVADDWTLGEAQLAWLTKTLQAATSKWRFLLVHHTVGGAAGDAINAAYGRGGGQAAGVGEQALIHELMIEHGVQVFFYGHDHVFTDMVVDGIHYTLPGSAGAPWKFTTQETGYANYWTESGHAQVRVSPEAVEIAFVAVGGELIHTYTIP